MNINPIEDYDYQGRTVTEQVSFADPRLVRVTRLRYVSDRGFPVWDLSYAHGLLNTGEYVRITVPTGAYQIPKSKPASTLIRLWPSLPKLVPGGYVKNILSLCQ